MAIGFWHVDAAIKNRQDLVNGHAISVLVTFVGGSADKVNIVVGNDPSELRKGQSIAFNHTQGHVELIDPDVWAFGTIEFQE